MHPSRIYLICLAWDDNASITCLLTSVTITKPLMLKAHIILYYFYLPSITYFVFFCKLLNKFLGARYSSFNNMWILSFAYYSLQTPRQNSFIALKSIVLIFRLIAWLLFPNANLLYCTKHSVYPPKFAKSNYLKNFILSPQSIQFCVSTYFNWHPMSMYSQQTWKTIQVNWQIILSHDHLLVHDNVLIISGS